MLAGIKCSAQSHAEVLKRMLHYGETHVVPAGDTLTTNVYSKYTINIGRRNVLLSVVPTMFYLLRDGQRNHLSESYSRVVTNGKDIDTHRYLHLSTIYHRHNTLPPMEKYVTPRLYEEKLFADAILSPANYHNRKYYRYRMRDNGDGTSYVSISSRHRNTQLIRRGYAIVDNATGRISEFSFEGEYDMIRSVLHCTMRDDSISVMPLNCDVQAKFSFMGNKIKVHLITMYGQKVEMPDSIEDSDDSTLMSRVRPIPLTDEEERIKEDYYKRHAKARSDTATTADGHKKRNWAKHIMWDIVGDNILNKIKTNIGGEEKGQIRIGPIFNPLYFGYTAHKGVIYRFDIKSFYNFTPNSDITARLKLGYSFKQKQLFYKIPVQWNFDKCHNGYILVEFGNGNRISNSRVLDNIKTIHHADSIDWNAMHLDYFRDTRFHLGFNIDVIKNTLGIETGFSKHRRSAVDRKGFEAAGRPAVYKTFAPFLQLQYRPLTDRVPLVITTQWEHGIKHFGGQIAYDRFEFDGQYVLDMPRMRSWQLRSGFGFYTHKGHDDYFLDYHNFHEDYISLGWEDRWSGEFEMLNANWYNASDYYFRANATYESPLLFLSFCPIVGQIVEKERIYLSALAVRGLLPYVEAGYGFTNRAFSMGIFTGWSKYGFEGVGMKFGFELFNNY